MSLPKNAVHHKTNLHDTSEVTNDSETTAALLTGVGRSAIAVIGVAGTGAPDAILRCFDPATTSPLHLGRIRYGIWRGTARERHDLPSNSPGATNPTSSSAAAAEAGESVVVVPLASDEFEVHCHGGVAATSRILDDLSAVGVIVVAADDGLWNVAEPTLIREAKTVLSRCLTTKIAAIALDQVRGAMHDWCVQALSDTTSIDAIKHQAKQSLAFARLTTRLSDRFQVVLAGPPNVGKSSLVNAIVGYDRSITMDIAGTTRDVLHADTVINGIPIRLSDTAGIRSKAGSIEQQGISKAQEAAENADLVVWVDQPRPEKAAEHLADEEKRLFVLNKADLLPGTNDHPLKTVATTGEGVEELMQRIADSLVQQFPEPGQAVPINDRQREGLMAIVDATSMEQCKAAIIDLMD